MAGTSHRFHSMARWNGESYAPNPWRDHMIHGFSFSPRGPMRFGLAAIRQSGFKVTICLGPMICRRWSWQWPREPSNVGAGGVRPSTRRLHRYVGAPMLIGAGLGGATGLVTLAVGAAPYGAAKWLIREERYRRGWGSVEAEIRRTIANGPDVGRRKWQTT